MAESGTVQVLDDRMRERHLASLHQMLWYQALPQPPPPCDWPAGQCTCSAAWYADGIVAAAAAWPPFDEDGRPRRTPLPSR